MPYSSSYGARALALSARARPLSRNWALFGDSRAALGTSSFASSTANWTLLQTEASTPVGKRSTGIPFWVEVYSKGAIRFPGTLNFGFSGDTIVNMATPARIGAAIAKCQQLNAAGLMLIASTNDLTAGTSLATILAALNTIVSQCQAAGLPIAICTDTPRGYTGGTAYQLSGQNLINHRAIRRYILTTFANVPGVYVVDAMPYLIDPTQSVAAYQDSSYAFADTLHPSCKGFQMIARCVVEQLMPLYGPYHYVPEDSGDLYDAVTNVNGGIGVNPFFTGTGGNVVTAAQGSGTLATSWSALYNNSTRPGLNVAYTQGFAKTDPLTGRPRLAQRIAYSGTPTGGSQQYDGLGQTLSTTTYPAGTKIRVVAEIDVAAGATGLQSIQIGIEGNRSNSPANPSNSTFFVGYAGQDNGYPIDTTLPIQNGFWITEDIVLPSDVSANFLRIKNLFATGAAVSATIDIYSIAAFIVP